MEGNQRSKEDQENPRKTKTRPVKRSASSHGEESSLCTNPATDLWDCNARSARGDEVMDLEVQKSPEMETRKRRLTVHANSVLDKKPRLEGDFSSASFCSEFRDEFNGCLEVQEQGMIFLVLSATTGNSKSKKSDVGCQTAKSPLVPVSPVVSFFEPVPQGPARLENSYFGAGALLEDGTLRRPPGASTPGPSTSKEVLPKTEEETEVKDWAPKKKEPTPQTKKDVAEDEDPKEKKKNTKNTDRYLNMF